MLIVNQTAGRRDFLRSESRLQTAEGAEPSGTVAGPPAVRRGLARRGVTCGAIPGASAQIRVAFPAT